MIDAETVGEVIRTYGTHGWVLRRVLLTAKLCKVLGKDFAGLFGDAVTVCEGDVDAAWFSRPPQRSEIAWEIRHLSETPFALLEYLDEHADDFELKRRDVESRLAKTVASRKEIPL